MASTAVSDVKCSSNSHVLRAMLTIGSMITRKGCETRSGPTCSAACASSKAATLPTARAYTGQCVNMPARPNWVSVSVVALMNVATSAHMTAAAEAYKAARRPGDPHRAAIARRPAPTQQASPAVSQ
jgi:hypothetical protein